MRLFSGADEDKSGSLSWFELEDFQKKIFSKYKYIQNDIALRPDLFVKNGGGDCDDWALLSAAFCLSAALS